MSRYDQWLLSGEPGGAGGDPYIEEMAAQERWDEEHPSCEICHTTLCLHDCGCVFKAPGFENKDGHHFCQGKCSEEAQSE